MKVAVTAASGKLGSAITRQLVQQIGAEHVVAFARTPEKASHLGVEVRKGDYDNASDFEDGLKDIDRLLIVSGMDDPIRRIAQHRTIIEAAKENGVKKLVYTSIIGDPTQTAFRPIVQSNRQTENDVINAGMDWAIGRNGLYIEPDLEYIDHYVQEGKIANCAGDGLCAYTSRKELAIAYAHLLIDDKLKGKIYNLVGMPISQQQLAEEINHVFSTQLTYEPIPVDDYLKNRKAALGDFLGTVVGGIYEGIKNGVFNVTSDFAKVVGRQHQSAREMMVDYKESQQ